MKIKSIKKAGNSFPAFSMNWYDWFSENGSLWEHAEVLHLSASQNPNTPHKYNQLQNHAKIIIVHAIWGHPTQSENKGPWIRAWWLFSFNFLPWNGLAFDVPPLFRNTFAVLEVCFVRLLPVIMPKR